MYFYNHYNYINFLVPRKHLLISKYYKNKLYLYNNSKVNKYNSLGKLYSKKQYITNNKNLLNTYTIYLNNTLILNEFNSIYICNKITNINNIFCNNKHTIKYNKIFNIKNLFVNKKKKLNKKKIHNRLHFLYYFNYYLKIKNLFYVNNYLNKINFLYRNKNKYNKNKIKKLIFLFYLKLYIIKLITNKIKKKIFIDTTKNKKLKFKKIKFNKSVVVKKKKKSLRYLRNKKRKRKFKFSKLSNTIKYIKKKKEVKKLKKLKKIRKILYFLKYKKPKKFKKFKKFKINFLNTKSSKIGIKYKQINKKINNNLVFKKKKIIKMINHLGLFYLNHFINFFKKNKFTSLSKYKKHNINRKLLNLDKDMVVIKKLLKQLYLKCNNKKIYKTIKNQNYIKKLIIKIKFFLSKKKKKRTIKFVISKNKFNLLNYYNKYLVSNNKVLLHNKHFRYNKILNIYKKLNNKKKKSLIIKTNHLFLLKYYRNKISYYNYLLLKVVKFNKLFNYKQHIISINNNIFSKINNLSNNYNELLIYSQKMQQINVKKSNLYLLNQFIKNLLLLNTSQFKLIINSIYSMMEINYLVKILEDNLIFELRKSYNFFLLDKKKLKKILIFYNDFLLSINNLFLVKNYLKIVNTYYIFKKQLIRFNIINQLNNKFNYNKIFKKKNNLKFFKKYYGKYSRYKNNYIFRKLKHKQFKINYYKNRKYHVKYKLITNFLLLNSFFSKYYRFKIKKIDNTIPKFLFFTNNNYDFLNKLNLYKFNLFKKSLHITSHITSKNYRYLISDYKHKIIKSNSFGLLGIDKKEMRLKKSKLLLGEKFLIDFRNIFKVSDKKHNELHFHLLKYKFPVMYIFKELVKYIRRKKKNYYKIKKKRRFFRFKKYRLRYFYKKNTLRYIRKLYKKHIKYNIGKKNRKNKKKKNNTRCYNYTKNNRFKKNINKKNNKFKKKNYKGINYKLNITKNIFFKKNAFYKKILTLGNLRKIRLPAKKFKKMKFKRNLKKNKFFSIIKYDVGILRSDKLLKCYNFVKISNKSDKLDIKKFIYTYIFLKLIRKYMYRGNKLINLFKKRTTYINKKRILYWYTTYLEKYRSIKKNKINQKFTYRKYFNKKYKKKYKNYKNKKLKPNLRLLQNIFFNKFYNQKYASYIVTFLCRNVTI